jgi:glucokinase
VITSSQAIGIDIGGTKTAVAAVDASGSICARADLETRSDRGFATCLLQLTEHIGSVLNKANWPAQALAGIGIGCAGPVNPLRGTIHNPYTLPGWDGADIVTPLRETFRVPVRLENDADAAAVGEFQFGAGREANPLVMVTLGTGIGGAVLVNGQIYRGVNGEHPELGHLRVLPDGPECYCGTRGCWESLASGTAITAAGKPFGFNDSRVVFAAAPGDTRAAAIVQRAVNATAAATWTMLHTVLPQRIILGGGIGEEHFDVFAAPMRQQISRATQILTGGVEIVKAKLGNAAGVIGAACLAFQPSIYSR